MRALSSGMCGLALSVLAASGCTLSGAFAPAAAPVEVVPSPPGRVAERPDIEEVAPEPWSADDLEPIDDADADIIRGVQAALNARGFSVGRPDGSIGAQTLRGIRLFKVARRMPVNDAITPGLLTELDVAQP